MGKASSREVPEPGSGRAETLPKMRPRTNTAPVSGRHNSMIHRSPIIQAWPDCMQDARLSSLSSNVQRQAQPQTEDACFPNRPQSMLMFDQDPWESQLAQPATSDHSKPKLAPIDDDLGLEHWENTLNDIVNADWDAELKAISHAQRPLPPAPALDRRHSLTQVPGELRAVQANGSTHHVPMRKNSKRRSQRMSAAAPGPTSARLSARGFVQVPRPKSTYKPTRGRDNPWMAVPDKRPAKPNLIALNRLDMGSRSQAWFCLARDKEESIALIDNHKAKLPEGAFVVHASGSAFAALCLLYRGELFHEQIIDTVDGLHLASRAKQKFKTIGQLIDHHSKSKQKGLPCRLLPAGVNMCSVPQPIYDRADNKGVYESIDGVVEPVYDRAHHNGDRMYDVGSSDSGVEDSGYAWLEAEDGMYDLGTETYLNVAVQYDQASGYISTEAVYDRARHSGYLDTEAIRDTSENVYDPRTLSVFRYDNLSDSEEDSEHEYAVPLDVTDDSVDTVDLSAEATGLRTPHGTFRRGKYSAKSNYKFPDEDGDKPFRDSVLADSDDEEEEFGFGEPESKKKYDKRGYLVPMNITDDHMEGFISISTEFFDETSRICGTAFTTCQNDEWFFAGLSCQETNYHHGRDCHFDDINFSIFCMGTGKATARENEDEVGPYISYQAGDQFQVRVGKRKGVRRVEYVKNNKVFYISTKKPVFPLFADQAFHPLNGGATLVRAVKWIFMP